MKPANLTVFLFGPPRAELNGASITMDTRKAMALLAFLALESAPVSRDRIAALLWPEYDSERARGALRRTLSTLKSATGDSVTADRGSIRLRASAETDVGQFAGALNAAAGAHEIEHRIRLIEEAAHIYKGRFMEGFSLRDAPDFDDWQSFQGEILERQMTSALEALSSMQTLSGDWVSAERNALRLLSMDRLNESAFRSLMRLAAMRGDRNQALTFYRDCVRTLDRELGVSPVEETNQLHEEIKRGEVGPAGPIAKVGRPGAEPPAPIPLVGRDREWKTLVGSYENIRADGAVVIIEGEAGVGKTRLANDFLDDMARRGTRTLVARSYAGEESLSFGLIADLVRKAFESNPELVDRLPVPALSQLLRFVPVLGRDFPPPPPIDSPGALTALFDAVATTIELVLKNGKPGALLLDDLHFTDRASLEAIGFVARRMEGRAFLLILGWRTEEVFRDHPLRNLQYGGEPAAVTISLSPLSRQETTELTSTIEPDIDRETTDRIFEISNGNPFLVIEYAKAARDEESIPNAVADLMRSRIRPLDSATRQILEAASVAGRTFDPATLRDASGRSEDETASAMELLTIRGFIQPVAEDSSVFALSHSTMRDFVASQINPARTRLLHERIAASLERTARGKRREEQAAVIAEHYRLAGDDEKAAQHFLLAAKHDRELFAISDALDHYRGAQALGHPDQTMIHAAMGDLYTLTGRYPEAIASYEAAASLASEGELAQVEHRLGQVNIRRGALDIAEDHLRSAVDLFDEREDPGFVSRVLADLSLVEYRRGNPSVAADIAERALELAEKAQDPEAKAQSHNILGMLDKAAGRFDASATQLQESLRIAEKLRDPGPKIAALNNLALTGIGQGDLVEARSLLERALELCRLSGDRHREAALENNLADLFHRLGERDQSMDHLKKAAAIFSHIGGEDEMEAEIWKLVEW